MTTTRRGFLQRIAAFAMFPLFYLGLKRVVDEMDPMRTAEVFDKEAHAWRPCKFKELKDGDYFRLREPNGTLADNGEVCIAHESAYVSDAGCWTIACTRVAEMGSGPTCRRPV